MRSTIVYDNTSRQENLAADWGFSCLVEAHGKTILFDTGARADILGQNMKALRIDPSRIDAVFISHDHWDHTGGLFAVMKIGRMSVYVPGSFRSMPDLYGLRRIAGPAEIFDNIFSTGELKAIEHSLVIRQEEGVVVVAGCSHPGVGEILEAASAFGNVTTLIGGFHGFDDFGQIAGLSCICPTHCTRHVDRIAAMYKKQYVSGGAGRVLEI